MVSFTEQALKIFDDERKLLILRKSQIEAELLNVNLRINDLTLKSDLLLKEVKNGN